MIARATIVQEPGYSFRGPFGLLMCAEHVHMYRDEASEDYRIQVKGKIVKGNEDMPSWRAVDHLHCPHAGFKFIISDRKGQKILFMGKTASGDDISFYWTGKEEMEEPPGNVQITLIICPGLATGRDVAEFVLLW